MKAKFLKPLSAKDKADKKSFRTLLSVKVIDRQAVTTLVDSMSERIKPNKFKFTAKGLPDKKSLTEDLKTEYTTARAKFYEELKPKKYNRQKSISPNTDEINIGGVTYIRKL